MMSWLSKWLTEWLLIQLVGLPSCAPIITCLLSLDPSSFSIFFWDHRIVHLFGRWGCVEGKWNQTWSTLSLSANKTTKSLLAMTISTLFHPLNFILIAKMWRHVSKWDISVKCPCTTICLSAFYCALKHFRAFILSTYLAIKVNIGCKYWKTRLSWKIDLAHRMYFNPPPTWTSCWR